MVEVEFDDIKHKSLEYLLLLVLGSKNREISLIHLEKELFVLWKFNPMVKDLVSFIAYNRGPFSPEIQEAALYPFYLNKLWTYRPPKKTDMLSGGFLKINSKGIDEYLHLKSDILDSKDNELRMLLNEIDKVRFVYDEMDVEELLLLIYTDYPEYTQKSTVYSIIDGKRDVLASRLKKKGLIGDKKYTELICKGGKIVK